MTQSKAKTYEKPLLTFSRKTTFLIIFNLYQIRSGVRFCVRLSTLRETSYFFTVADSDIIIIVLHCRKLCSVALFWRYRSFSLYSTYSGNIKNKCRHSCVYIFETIQLILKTQWRVGTRSLRGVQSYWYSSQVFFISYFNILNTETRKKPLTF